jgi:hypothetical protein
MSFEVVVLTQEHLEELLSLMIASDHVLAVVEEQLQTFVKDVDSY